MLDKICKDIAKINASKKVTIENIPSCHARLLPSITVDVAKKSVLSLKADIQFFREGIIFYDKIIYVLV
jgi:molybdenum cofactor biosynthesis enzyme